MSLDMHGFLEDVKRAAIEAVSAGKPFAFTLGKVTSLTPLRVQIDQKLELGNAQLVLTNAVRDFNIRITMGISSESTPSVYRVHLGLKIGEQVLLLRADGGQKYIILDRVEAPI